MRGVKFLHAFVSPTADKDYLPGVTVPESFINSTKMMRVYASADQQLARNEFGVFVDDVDLQQIDVSNSPIFVINMVETGGIWAETADGRYKAYIYINSAPETRAGMTVSMKRLKVR